MARSLRLAGMALALAPFSAGLHAGLAAQSTAPAFRLTIDDIMRGPELYGREPQSVRWSADGKWIYFQWLEPGASWREPLRPFRVRAVAGATPERVTPAQMDSASPAVASGSRSPDRRWRAVSAQGDLWLIEEATGRMRRLTQTVAVEAEPTFSADGREIFFIRDDNVFALALDGGLTRQLTDIRVAGAATQVAAAGGRGQQALSGARGRGEGGGAGGDTSSGQRAGLRTEQRALLEAVRDRLWQDSVAAAERRERERLGLTRFDLLSNERVVGLSVSPGGRALVITTATPGAGAQSVVVPNYITASGYTEEIPGRTKVGDVQGAGRLLLMSVPSGTARALRVAPGDDTGPSANAVTLGWNDAGTAALVLATTRDFKRRYLATVSADSGAVRVVDVLHDTAWVGGPCARCAGWYADPSRGTGSSAQRIWFVSEADGYAHLYTVAADGTDRRQLTSGPWEVTKVTLSRDGKSFYIESSEESPFQQHVYRMAVTGGPRTKLTRGVGGHTAVLSPDESMLADLYSEANRPPELFLQANRPGAESSRLTLSPTAAWLAFPWIRPEIVRVPASDGVRVPARIYRPKEMGAAPNGAAVIFVHGAGYLHNVHDYWSSYAREYMFNQYLASKGYVVLDMDYRGSAGYGRDWRTAIYRHMGGRDLQDEVDGVRFLKSTFGVDPSRVGIYGGSYGGFMTLMALFTTPEWFGAGAALRPVTNWSHYNHPYTGAILNLPQDDTLAYRRSSPIWFAGGLRAPLLVCHGMVDTNVNFQDSVELTERLIELGKKDWELAVYPVEDHGFVRPSSWADEYRRISELFDRVLVRRGTSSGSSSGSR